MRSRWTIEEWLNEKENGEPMENKMEPKKTASTLVPSDHWLMRALRKLTGRAPGWEFWSLPWYQPEIRDEIRTSIDPDSQYSTAADVVELAFVKDLVTELGKVQDRLQARIMFRLGTGDKREVRVGGQVFTASVRCNTNVTFDKELLVRNGVPAALIEEATVRKPTKSFVVVSVKDDGE